MMCWRRARVLPTLAPFLCLAPICPCAIKPKHSRKLAIGRGPVRLLMKNPRSRVNYNNSTAASSLIIKETEDCSRPRTVKTFTTGYIRRLWCAAILTLPEDRNA